jgi:peroxiredoxin Q/BCP
MSGDYEEAGAVILGISLDDVDSHRKFAEKYALPFPLLADPKGEAVEAYGVKGVGYARRVSFVIDGEGFVTKVLEGGDALDPTGALEACPLHKKAEAPK